MLKFTLRPVDHLAKFKLFIADRGVIKDIPLERDRIDSMRVISGPPGAGLTGDIDLGTF